MNESYQKARRTLGLVSGLLIAWEYIGIGVPEEVKMPMTDSNVKVAHPEVIPVVLFVLALYFMARLVLEWAQNSNESRQRWAKVDFGLSLALATTGLGVYLVQALSDIRVADAVDSRDVIAISIATLILIVNLAGVKVAMLQGWIDQQMIADRFRIAQSRVDLFLTAGISAIEFCILTLFAAFGMPSAFQGAFAPYVWGFGVLYNGLLFYGFWSKGRRAPVPGSGHR